MDRMNKQYRVLISVGVGFILISLAVSVSHSCNGTVDFSILYEDGQIKDVRVDFGADKVSDNETNTPIPLQGLRFSQESSAGENGIRIDNERHHIQLIPGGTSGSSVVYLFDYEAEAPVWTTIDVYCQPLGLAYIQVRDEIVGYCAVNTTYKGDITCVPYFKLRFTNNQWIDVTSQPGSCSEALSTANITNVVILQADSVYEVDETRMYFAERGTNRLQGLSLSLGQQLGSYEVDALLKIDYLVPAVNTGNTSFRVVCRIENSSSLYHKSFIWSEQNTARFIDGCVVTESIAFDSYHFADYLVTFSTNRNTVIIMKDGKSNYYPLQSTLDNPIQCQDLATPVTHYLICLAKNGLCPLLINITDSEVTNQSICQSKKITRMEILTENLFYLLNNQQEFLIYVITTTVIHVGTYTVRPDVNFIITAASSNVNCTVEENVDSSNTDKSRSNLVAILVPIGLIIVMAVLTAAAVVVYLKSKNRRGIVRKQVNTNGHHNDTEINKRVHNDDLMDKPIHDDTTTNPTLENRDTGQRTAEDLPTTSVEVYQETSGSNQDRMIVMAPNYQNFLNLEPTTATRRANESNSETIPVEVHSDQVIDPRECAEDIMIIPPTAEREDPIGGGDTRK